ncbi:MAG: hypothetical protein AMJ84_05415 [Acidithiobacillales bacterium SM23_46]|nr:MAG: hypothetical protein AMJ84_05415 [Acidithiobacillales bacterium SM23_46]KPL27975.1 MAG: hypothetical protein AMJ72_05940 [Acidithiobacillales bacterium SM1_46]
MAKRGPKPMPTKILKLRGSNRAGRRKGGVNVPLNRPRIPRWLTGEARREWQRTAPLLARLGLLTQIDRTMLAIYCQAFADWRQADRFLQDMIAGGSGVVVVTKKGNVVQNPALAVRNQAVERLRKIAAEFGMSPASRVGLETQPRATDQQQKQRFFGGA